MAERLTLEKLPVGRNTLLLSAGMATLYGMVQLWAAVTPITFEAVTGLEGLVGLGPAIFMSTAALAALPAGRAMDRLRQVPVLAGDFALGILRCIPVGTENALVISDLGIVPDGSHHRGLLATLSAPQLVTFWRVAPLGTVLGDLLRRQVS